MRPGKLVIGLVGSASALAMTWGAPALAQDAAATSVQEVVVTAQRREERLQEVPIAISVIGGGAAAELGARGFETMQGRIPGLQVFGIDQMSMQFAIRGVVTDRSARTPPTAALYFDDVPVGLGSANPNFQQLDIERVEVLRGPQGTLYGAGAQAGALRIITAKPDLGRFGVGGGIEGAGTKGGGASGLAYAIINAPLQEDRAGFRALAYLRRQGGYIDNATLGLDDTNRTDIVGGRLSLRVQPSERLRLDAMVAHQTLTADDSDLANVTRADYEQTTSVLQDLEASNTLASLTAGLDVGIGELTYVGSYQETDSFRRIDATRYAVILGAPAGRFPQAAFPTDYYQSGWTQELRLTSRDEGRFTWIVGGFLSNVENGIAQSMVTPGFEAAVPAARPASSFGLQPDNLYEGVQEFRTRQVALFADGAFKVTEQLTASAGLRWYRYEQEGRVDYNGLLQGRRDVLAAETEEDGLNPRFNLAYSPHRDLMVYAQAARGFRTGGLNEPVPAGVCGADLAAIGISAPPLGYDSDKLWNYEVGLKGAALDRRLSFALTAFHIDWRDIQVTKRLPCGYAVILNGGELDSQGVEFELSARPLPGLTLWGSGAYTDSKIAETSAAIGLGTAVGQRAPYQPKWAFNLGAEYRWTVAAETDAYVTLEMSHTGRRLTDFNPASAFVMPSFEVVNVRLGIERGDWEALLFVDNLTEEYGVLDITRRGGSFPVYTSATPIRPRTAGFRLIKSF